MKYATIRLVILNVRGFVEMEIISKDLAAVIKNLTKPLGVRAKKATLFLETTTNGLSVLVKCDGQYFNTYDQNCQIKSDGHAVLMLNDLLLLLPLATATSLATDNSGALNVNGVPVVSPEIAFEQLPTILGHQVRLTQDAFETLLKACQGMRKKLKKSIFNESQYLQVQFAQGLITIKHLSPLVLNTKELTVQGINNVLTFYLSKNDLRSLTLFKTAKLVSFACNKQLLISDSDISYIAPAPDINEGLFNPEYQPKGA